MSALGMSGNRPAPSSGGGAQWPFTPLSLDFSAFTTLNSGAADVMEVDGNGDYHIECDATSTNFAGNNNAPLGYAKIDSDISNEQPFTISARIKSNGDAGFEACGLILLVDNDSYGSSFVQVSTRGDIATFLGYAPGLLGPWGSGSVPTNWQWVRIWISPATGEMALYGNTSTGADEPTSGWQRYSANFAIPAWLTGDIRVGFFAGPHNTSDNFEAWCSDIIVRGRSAA